MLEVYIDVDISGDPDYRKSTFGFVVTFIGGAVSWQLGMKVCFIINK